MAQKGPCGKHGIRGCVSSSASEISGKGHQVAINGFIAWLLIIIASVVYFIWAFTPTKLLDAAFSTYYPDKYWAVAIPAMLVMTTIYYLTTQLLLMFYVTNPLTDEFCVLYASTVESRQSLGGLTDVDDGVPPVMEIPVSITSKLLFQPRQ